MAPAGAVLFLDEAEGLLGARCAEPSSAADHGVNAARGTLLRLLEQSDAPVVLATNLPRAVDAAFRRRILLSLRFELPDEPARARILDRAIPSGVPLDPATARADFVAALAVRSAGYSGGDLAEAAGHALLLALHDRGEAGPLLASDFDEAFAELEQGRAAVGRAEPRVTVEDVTDRHA